jgi:hypothetical protein
MILTSQNRIAVNQTNFANDRGQVLPAVVVHQLPSTMRPYSGMRRTRRLFGMKPTFSESKRRPITEAHRSHQHGHQPAASCASALALTPRLWARLVLCKMSRG